LFSADDGAMGQELWFSDGTTAGTRLVKDIDPAGSSSPNRIVNVGLFAMFSANDGSNGAELWRTDGTTAGTMLVKDLNPGPASARILSAARVGRGASILFAGNDGQSGDELYVSSGTASSTRLQLDVFPGVVGSVPTRLVRAGTWVFFFAEDPVAGYELFGVPVRATGGALAEPYGNGCAGSNGVPRIDARGVPAPGASDFAVEVHGALPYSGAVLLLSDAAAEIQVGACTLLVDPGFFLGFAAAIDGVGEGALPLPLPNDPSLLGGQLFMQWLVADPSGQLLGLASMSNGLMVLIGQ
jgi:ELWxxDGT repeat protein